MAKNPQQQQEEERTILSPSKILEPEVLTAFAIASMSNEPGNKRIAAALAKELESISEEISQGNYAYLEKVLISQIVALSQLTTQFLSKGQAGFFEPALMKSLPNHGKNLINLALKAQNQTRQTIETLKELKNPKKTTFIKNQVNNLQMELEQRIEALEEQNEQILESGTEAITIRANQELEAMGKVNRSKNTRRAK